MTPPKTRRAGRPTSEEASLLDEQIKEAALDLFLESGLERTTMDQIAAGASTTKATLYARYENKETLFLTVLRWAIQRDDWPFREPTLPNVDDLEGSLRAIADASVKRALHPSMVRLSRIANAQASHFPEIAGSTVAHWPRQQAVVEILERHRGQGTIEVEDPELAAEIFLGMVAAAPARLASYGVVRSARVQRAHTDAAVKIFLDGLRARPATRKPRG